MKRWFLVVLFLVAVGLSACVSSPAVRVQQTEIAGTFAATTHHPLATLTLVPTLVPTVTPMPVLPEPTSLPIKTEQISLNPGDSVQFSGMNNEEVNINFVSVEWKSAFSPAGTAVLSISFHDYVSLYEDRKYSQSGTFESLLQVGDEKVYYAANAPNVNTVLYPNRIFPYRIAWSRNYKNSDQITVIWGAYWQKK